MAKKDDEAGDSLPDISGMKAGEMRKELESYGISTKSFFEKKEFVHFKPWKSHAQFSPIMSIALVL